MNRVWDNKELKGGRLLVMLVLADHANDAGECWPSQPHLATRARLNERQVRRVVDSLDKDGYILILERGVGRSKRPHYRLFPLPLKSDILSDIKADILSEEKSDISDTKSDILIQENRTFPTGKSDISDAVSSHARSDPPIEPITDPPIEPSSLEDEDEKPADAIDAAWLEVYGTYMPENILPAMNKLLVECGEVAVVYGIRASVAAKVRGTAYIAKCARNYIPPAAASNGATYRVEMPTVTARPTPQASLPTLPPRTATPTDPWSVCLAELRSAYTLSDWVAMLDGSRLEPNGGAVDADGQYVPRYRVLVAPGADVQRLANRALRQIRFTLGSLLVGKFMLEIVPYGTGFAEPVLEPTP